MSSPTHVLLRTGEGERRPIEADSVFHLEAEGGNTRLRLGGKKVMTDSRPIGDLIAAFAPFGFVRIHRAHAVNPRRVLAIRRRRGSRDWELKLEPPVGRVLPIGRNYLADLWAAYGASPE